MNNTEFEILSVCALREHAAGVTAFELVGRFYPRSRQPLKKAHTFEGCLRSMARRGWLQRRGPKAANAYTEVRYVLTALGRTAGRAEFQRRRRERGGEDEPFMRLVR